MLKKLLPPKLRSKLPTLRGQVLNFRADTEKNMEDIAVANFELQKESLQKNLTIMHYTMLAAFLAVAVSIVVCVFVIRNKPVVIVKPDVTVQTK